MPTLNGVRAVLLDMGGVLLEMGNAQGMPAGKWDWRGREALLARLRQAGARLSEDELEETLFAPWRADYERRYELGREASWHPHLVRLRRRSGVRLRDLTLLAIWFAPYAESVVAAHGARETLKALAKRGLRLALVSNVPLPGKLYHRLLVREGLARYLSSFHFSYDAGSRKPSPGMVREALANLTVAPREAIMVGDRRGSDVAAGRTAAVRTVWIRSEDAGGPAPDAVITSLAELPDLL